MKTKLFLFFSFIALQVNAQCWDKIASGAYHTVAIAGDGTLWSWGYNNSGQLGDATLIDKNVPTKIGTDNDWVAIGTGHYHSFGIKSNGTLWAWGYNNYGQLGRGSNGNGTNLLSPTQIGTDTNWQSVTGGEFFTLATKTDGTLWSAGKNTNGQLGINNLTDQNVFQQVGTDTDWNKIACGRSHSLALKTNGVLYLWGANGGGQLGLTHTVDRRVPTVYASSVAFTEIAGGISSSIAIKSDGKMFRAGYGCPIPNSTYTMAEYIVSPADWKTVKIGNNFVVAIKTDGSMWVIGVNDYGQYGNPSFNQSTTFTQPTLNTGWALNSSSLSVNYFGVLSLNSSGQLYGTGQNHVGQLGKGTTTNASSFSAVSCPSSIVLSSDSFESQNSVLVYPNPAQDVLTVSSSLEIQKLSVIDITGKLVKTQNGNATTIAVNDLKSGFYFLEITIDGKSETKKFVKQ
jgi:alpha-tubulin suppressor-like RCC1 family protein